MILDHAMQIIFTRDAVTSENHQQVTERVAKIVTHDKPYIILFCIRFPMLRIHERYHQPLIFPLTTRVVFSNLYGDVTAFDLWRYADARYCNFISVYWSRMRTDWHNIDIH